MESFLNRCHGPESDVVNAGWQDFNAISIISVVSGVLFYGVVDDEKKTYMKWRQLTGVLLNDTVLLKPDGELYFSVLIQ